MDGIQLRDEQVRNRVRQASEFLDSDDPDRNLRPKIIDMLNRGQRRLTVSIDEIRSHNRDLAHGLLHAPFDHCQAFDQALRDIVAALPGRPPHESGEDVMYYCAYVGSFGEFACNPRTLSSNSLNRLVALEGIVTKCSLVRPKVVKSVHYNEKRNIFHFREYRDQTMTITGPASTSVYPQEDEEGNPLITEYGYCTYRDHQTISIQEMPERAPAGQLPRSVDVILDDDLVDSCKPGDRIQLVGIYRSLGNRTAGQGSATFRTLILANNIILLSSKSGGGIAQSVITYEDIRNINKVAKKKNVFDLLSQSLAPSIYGYNYIKKAILLMLLGGMEKNLDNGTHLRGDINILMVGDPSTAKSQLLRFVLNTAPLAIATTGRGSSGVGLTAAVTSDKETGERRLEAGAMVLGDRGVVCIDEFDKMSDIDRVAIHEVMEQQTVTIAKAGIHTSLNARCSVIAAANPIYGQYDTHKDPHKNIALPDSLLSRFDLLFIVTDDIDDVRDRRISEHVLRMHRFRQAGMEEGTPIRDDNHQSFGVGLEQGKAASQTTQVYEKFNVMLHAGVTVTSGRGSARKVEVLSIPFIKKYIQYAKSQRKPVLTKGAADLIVSTYSNLRNDEMEGNQRKTSPMTARTLETLIRLSTAHAKARLSHKVEEKDAEAAEAILRFALFKEVVQVERRKRRKTRRVGDDDAMSTDGSSDSDDADEQDDTARTKNRRPEAQMNGDQRNIRAATSQPRPVNGGAINTGLSNNEDDVYETGREATEGLSGRRTGDLSQSQMSMASSAPASQLLTSQGDEDSQATAVLTNGQGEDIGAVQISTDRLRVLRSAIGQLISTEIFENECADVSTLVGAVNERIRRTNDPPFAQPELVSGLHAMSERNEIMYAESDGMVYKI